MAPRVFNVVFEDAGDGWVYAHVPELPEVQTQGESLEQARVMVRDAITLVFGGARLAWRADPRDRLGARGAGRDRRLKKRELERHLKSTVALLCAKVRTRDVGERGDRATNHRAPTR